ncbi:hypothetical protein OMK64_04800 [Cellulomonas fimi]|uniref:hypothetical protein n=1 Tax=Cellulomonas fimi TaxID=1708 RepID=UPI00234C7657|nr:hypothetical protein [Cellulomonas fimi]MDC7120846.1 hypothetical protein [Cellulomonas fimi]
MTITPSTLMRGAAVAGAMFIGVQIGHPHLAADFIASTAGFIRGCVAPASVEARS